MARRKNDTIADDLLHILMAAPWWVGPLLAFAAFLFFRLVIPLILGAGAGDGHDPMTMMPRQAFGGFSVLMAPWIAAFVLLCWGVTELKKFANRRLLDNQSGLDSVGELSWQDFEELVGEVYCRQGYEVERTGSTSADGGIDLILRRSGKTVLVQCKHWKAWNVGVSEVRELRGVVASEGADEGVLVTYGTFSDDAIAFADRNPITLVRGSELERMIRSVQRANPKTHSFSGGRLGGARQEDPSRRESCPSPIKASAAPRCPQCGAEMAKRMAKRGHYSGQPFWSCSRYPQCRGKRPM